MCASAYLLKFFFDNDKSLYKKILKVIFVPILSIQKKQGMHSKVVTHIIRKKKKAHLTSLVLFRKGKKLVYHKHAFSVGEKVSTHEHYESYDVRKACC